MIYTDFGPTLLYVKTLTKLKKREAVKVSKELQALNALRANPDIADAITAYLVRVELAPQQQNRLRATLAVLSHAPLNQKLLASL